MKAYVVILYWPVGLAFWVMLNETAGNGMGENML